MHRPIITLSAYIREYSIKMDLKEDKKVGGGHKKKLWAKLCAVCVSL